MGEQQGLSLKTVVRDTLRLLRARWGLFAFLSLTCATVALASVGLIVTVGLWIDSHRSGDRIVQILLLDAAAIAVPIGALWLWLVIGCVGILASSEQLHGRRPTLRWLLTATRPRLKQLAVVALLAVCLTPLLLPLLAGWQALTTPWVQANL